MLATSPKPALAGAGERLFEIPGHGLLGLQVMGYWESRTNFQTADGFPRIHLSHDGGMPAADGNERINVTVMPVWRTDESPADFGTEQGVRRLVREYADEMEAILEIDRLALLPVGHERIGFWFLASGEGFFSSRLADGFSHARVGALVAGELVVTFTIFTDDEPSAAGKLAIELLSFAEHVPGSCTGKTLNCYSSTDNLHAGTQKQ